MSSEQTQFFLMTQGHLNDQVLGHRHRRGWHGTVAGSVWVLDVPDLACSEKPGPQLCHPLPSKPTSERAASCFEILQPLPL